MRIRKIGEEEKITSGRKLQIITIIVASVMTLHSLLAGVGVEGVMNGKENNEQIKNSRL